MNCAFFPSGAHCHRNGFVQCAYPGASCKSCAGANLRRLIFAHCRYQHCAEGPAETVSGPADRIQFSEFQSVICLLRRRGLAMSSCTCGGGQLARTVTKQNWIGQHALRERLRTICCEIHEICCRVRATGKPVDNLLGRWQHSGRCCVAGRQHTRRMLHYQLCPYTGSSGMRCSGLRSR